MAEPRFTPSGVKAPHGARVMEMTWQDGHTSRFPHELLRGYCPCAGCQGHSGTVAFQSGGNLDLVKLEPVGNYAIRPVFSDGHDSGLYSWDVLYNLGSHHDQLWQAYLDRLSVAGASRDPGECPAVPAKPQGNCSKH